MTGFDGFDTTFDRWFDAGWEVCKGDRSDRCYPPLNDMIAQCAWLCGFRSAWIAFNGEEWLCRQAAQPCARIECAAEHMDVAVSMQLVEALEGRHRLLTQILAGEQDPAASAVH
jgi:hypothetical protein